MFYTASNAKLQVNGNEILASNADLSLGTSIQPNYTIRQRSTNSTGDLVELAGEYHGEHYDLLKVDIGTGGGYGTATFTVSYLSNDQLEGAVTSAETITCGLQHIFNGLYGRFQGNQFHANDYWYIEVYGRHRKQTNKSNATIEMTR